METADLDRKLAHVLEPRMRVQLVREQVLQMSPVEVCALLRVVLARPPGASGSGDALRESLLALFTHGDPVCEPGDLEPLPYAFVAGVYAEASRGGAQDVVRLLRTLPAQRALEEPERRLPLELAEIPLGRRRSLARGDDSRLLEKLALDPDPTVVANLLRNPRTREADVVRIAAMRPVSVATLREVDRSARWSRLPKVRVALARNPYCPPDLAIKVLGTIALGELRAMRHDPDLHPETLSQVRAEIARRSPP